MKLQYNFTTPEQTDRLKKAGVPEASADLYYSRYNQNGTYWGAPKVIENGNYYTMLLEKEKHEQAFYLPCWSLGRLIDIVLTDADVISVLGRKNVNTQMEQVIKLLESGIIDLTNLKKIV